MTCGAVNAILDSVQHNARAVRECRVLTHSPEGEAPLDLCATATSFQVGGDRFVLAAIEDISHEKRLAVLQRLLPRRAEHGGLHSRLRGLPRRGFGLGPGGQRLADRPFPPVDRADSVPTGPSRAESGEMKTQPVPFRRSRFSKSFAASI